VATANSDGGATPTAREVLARGSAGAAGERRRAEGEPPVGGVRARIG
jgi:hypothetical protein